MGWIAVEAKTSVLGLRASKPLGEIGFHSLHDGWAKGPASSEEDHVAKGVESSGYLQSGLIVINHKGHSEDESPEDIAENEAKVAKSKSFF